MCPGVEDWTLIDVGVNCQRTNTILFYPQFYVSDLLSDWTSCNRVRGSWDTTNPTQTLPQDPENLVTHQRLFPGLSGGWELSLTSASSPCCVFWPSSPPLPSPTAPPAVSAMTRGQQLLDWKGLHDLIRIDKFKWCKLCDLFYSKYLRKLSKTVKLNLNQF